MGSKLKNGALNPRSPRVASPKRVTALFTEDIEPDDLIPAYIETQTKLFEIQRPRQEAPRGKGPKSKPNVPVDSDEAMLLAKLDKIEKDILFDKFVADQQWRDKKIMLEKAYAQAKKTRAVEEKQDAADVENSPLGETDEINEEAARIAAEILAENGENEDDDDEALADLFSSLPVSEVDPVTGKTNTVLNGADGSKVIIRDFGKWNGVSPSRALEEACRARDSSVRITYRLVSDAAFANRHVVDIAWSKPQEVPPSPEVAEMETFLSPERFVFKMVSISTPDSKQSEAFIATTALFFIFGVSAKEEKVSLRLPPAWKDLWSEFAEQRKSKADELDRIAIKKFRDMVRARAEQELEDGVVLPRAFKGKVQAKNLTDSEHSDHERAKRQQGGPEYYQNIWHRKSGTPRFQHMLVCSRNKPLTSIMHDLTLAAIANATPDVELPPGGRGCCGSGADRYHMW